MRQQVSTRKQETRIRSHIAANLHDELGSLLLRVQRQTELLLLQSHKDEANLERLLDTTRLASSAMRDVAWGLDAEADTVNALVFVPEAPALYPNPAQARTTLNLSSLPPGIYKVTLVNMTGRKVQTLALTGGKAHELELGGLPGGAYLVVIRNDSLNLTKRLLKQYSVPAILPPLSTCCFCLQDSPLVAGSGPLLRMGGTEKAHLGGTSQRIRAGWPLLQIHPGKPLRANLCALFVFDWKLLFRSSFNFRPRRDSRLSADVLF